MGVEIKIKKIGLKKERDERTDIFIMIEHI